MQKRFHQHPHRSHQSLRSPSMIQTSQRVIPYLVIRLHSCPSLFARIQVTAKSPKFMVFKLVRNKKKNLHQVTRQIFQTCPGRRIISYCLRRWIKQFVCGTSRGKNVFAVSSTLTSSQQSSSTQGMTGIFSVVPSMASLGSGTSQIRRLQFGMKLMAQQN